MNDAWPQARKYEFGCSECGTLMGEEDNDRGSRQLFCPRCYEHPSIPRMPELLDCSVEEACEKRWAWGKSFPVGTRLEDEGCDRVAIFEAYEEILDCLNYLQFDWQFDWESHEMGHVIDRMGVLAEEIRVACCAWRDGNR